ncbi:MAG: hypothetical protein DRP08_03280 [Candidatus Aenigmatarchaeota archaeon]|nr:MAG: hypothetical protein DRP08_03280 [Candidatus Aenigmarchaeota archaeon]
MNCYKCKWSEEIPGGAHIRCVHPKVEAVSRNPLLCLLSILGSRGGPQAVFIPKEMGVELDEAGVRKGWCNFPWNFDPVWVKKCDCFEEA